VRDRTESERYHRAKGQWGGWQWVNLTVAGQWEIVQDSQLSNDRKTWQLTLSIIFNRTSWDTAVIFASCGPRREAQRCPARDVVCQETREIIRREKKDA
jgi:hypothetical protein